MIALPPLDTSRIQCLIFDLDGTLVDSEILCLRAFCDCLPTLDWDIAHMARHFRGWKLHHIFHEIECHLGQPLADDFEQHYRARVAELFDAELRAFDGADTFLASVPHPKCIASSGPMRKMLHSLTLTGLLPHFEGRLFSAYDVGAWKPDPDLFLHAADKMGFAPTQCLVIEDSLVGLEAACAANMQALLHRPENPNSHCECLSDYQGPVFSSYRKFPDL